MKATQGSKRASAVRRRKGRTSERGRKGDSISKFMAQWRKEKPNLDVSSLGVLGRIWRLATYSRGRADKWLKPMGLSWESFSIVVALRRSGKPYELRPTDLYQEALLSSGAITNRIDSVERKGWVERYHDPSDRRGTIVRLTPAGKAIADKAIEMHFPQMAGLLAGLGRDEWKELSVLLEKLLCSFESED